MAYNSCSINQKTSPTEPEHVAPEHVAADT